MWGSLQMLQLPLLQLLVCTRAAVPRWWEEVVPFAKAATENYFLIND